MLPISPRSVGLGLTASCASGALNMAASMHCHRQETPSSWSSSARPACLSIQTPRLVHVLLALQALAYRDHRFDPLPETIRHHPRAHSFAYCHAIAPLPRVERLGAIDCYLRTTSWKIGAADERMFRNPLKPLLESPKIGFAVPVEHCTFLHTSSA